MGDWHPERPERLDAVMRALEAVARHAQLDWRQAPEASREALLRVHSEAHVHGIETVVPAASDGLFWIDPDTAMNAHSAAAARRAAGAAVAAVDAVLDGEIARAFCAVRPPGHHAERKLAMGFCLFNNVACGAAHALSRGLRRIAILDFDVHHGNGTEDIFRDDERVLFCSSFQHPFYPQRPLARRDHLVHVPLPEGADGEAFRRGLDRHWWPAIERFAPELILVSAGFDGHRDDPLAGLALDDDHYRWVSERIAEYADRYAGGRVVSLLEGGYDLETLGRCAAVHVAALAGLPHLP
jgi:acetoin utilization deacetylase AcuC-like enzyme